MSPAQQIREAFRDPTKWGDRFVFESHWIGLGAFGFAAVWMFAHLPAPQYRRERHQFPSARGEVVQSPTDYRRNGGDCDDDVLAVVQFSAMQGLPAGPQFLGNPPKHVQAIVANSDGPGGAVVDRIPGAKRWAVWS